MYTFICYLVSDLCFTFHWVCHRLFIILLIYQFSVIYKHYFSLFFHRLTTLIITLFSLSSYHFVSHIAYSIPLIITPLSYLYRPITCSHVTASTSRRSALLPFESDCVCRRRQIESNIEKGDWELYSKVLYLKKWGENNDLCWIYVSVLGIVDVLECFVDFCIDVHWKCISPPKGSHPSDIHTHIK